MFISHYLLLSIIEAFILLFAVLIFVMLQKRRLRIYFSTVIDHVLRQEQLSEETNNDRFISVDHVNLYQHHQIKKLKTEIDGLNYEIKNLHGQIDMLSGSINKSDIENYSQDYSDRINTIRQDELIDKLRNKFNRINKSD